MNNNIALVIIVNNAYRIRYFCEINSNKIKTSVRLCEAKMFKYSFSDKDLIKICKMLRQKSCNFELHAVGIVNNL